MKKFIVYLPKKFYLQDPTPTSNIAHAPHTTPKFEYHCMLRVIWRQIASGQVKITTRTTAIDKMGNLLKVPNLTITDKAIWEITLRRTSRQIIRITTVKIHRSRTRIHQ